MLRAVSTIYIESQALARGDILKLSRICAPYSTARDQTVLSKEASKARGDAQPAARAAGSEPPPRAPAPPPPRSRRAWTAAAALALTASLGGVYFYRKLNDDAENDSIPMTQSDGRERAEAGEAEVEAAVPARADELPAHVQYLLVGGGTAAFAAMRAIRSARPDAQVLIVSEEPALPYMRPPLSKELWREPDLARRALTPESLTFRQWNGRRRSVTYEPAAFYTAPERLREAAAGAGVARGWRVARVLPERHAAELQAPGASATLTYDKCLIATGVQPRRVGALRAAAGAGRALALRGVRDAARLAAALDRADTRRVLVVGGGFLACELSAALADRLRDTGKTVRQVFREAAPMSRVLPHYLAAAAARRLAADGVQLLPHTEITDSEVREDHVRLRVVRAGDGAGEDELEADLVVECVGCEPDERLARASGLELHGELGGLLVNAELQARADVFAAGDAACFHDVALGRRRVEHHDHAVASGRLAGENMAALNPPKPYTHQSMFWSDLGPNLGYEAIGIIDSRLPTVGVFSADAVKAVERVRAVAAAAAEAGDAVATSGGAAATGGDTVVTGGDAVTTGGDTVATGGDAVAAGAAAGQAAGGEAQQFERGVVFYLREERVVGVLLWNLFNRMHVARQVLAHGKFDDLFEVAKLFTPHEED
ncbi:apoptosis-inducing factor 1, mitochondrial-like [Epargyreus clarus]|uniref:apoptosis-inducing factor 1, mitochondrial-like n=1 Tax=Epargyreus clarus TaxID=520877 RepID=UPI003C2DCD50